MVARMCVRLCRNLCQTMCMSMLAVSLAGCGDGHDYPAGFEAQASRDEASFKAHAAASGADPVTPAPDAPKMSSGASAGQMGAPRGDFYTPPPVDSTEDSATQAVAVSQSIVTELKLPEPPAVVVVDGEAEFQKLASNRKFDDFRRMCARYIQLKGELLPYGVKMADGVSTAEDRATHAKIERAMEGEFPRINRYMWNDRWTELDRAAMGWILNGSFAKKR